MSNTLRLFHVPCDRRGFTLIELVVILVLIGILSALAIPLFTGMIPRFHVRRAGSSVKHALEYTRSRAMANPQTHAGIHCVAGEDHFHIFFDANDNTMFDLADSSELETVHFGTNVFFSDSLSDTLVLFRGDGTAHVDASFLITDKSNKYQKTITVRKTSGSIRMN